MNTELRRLGYKGVTANEPPATELANGKIYQPMDTAPKNGAGILALLPDSNFPVGIRWNEGRWCVAWDDSPLGEFDQPRLYMRIPDEDATTLAAQPAAAGVAVSEVRALYRHCVNIMESGRDQIIARGGDCDPVDVMEKSDPVLSRIRDLLAAAPQPEGMPAFACPVCGGYCGHDKGVTCPAPAGRGEAVAKLSAECSSAATYLAKQNPSAADLLRRASMKLSAAPVADEPISGNWIAADDLNRLVRELDVALNGEGGSAKQASLCDVVGQVQSAVRRLGTPLLAKAKAHDADADADAERVADIYCTGTTALNGKVAWLFDEIAISNFVRHITGTL